MHRTSAGLFGGVLAFATFLLLGLLSAAGASAAGCPNEAFRLGPSAQLPECRAYEMVSPVEKNGSNISQRVTVHVSPNGRAAHFFSTASFAGSPSSPLGNSYLSRRGSDNWATEALDPPEINPGAIVFITSPATSPNLDKTLEYSKYALAPGAIENGSNIYLRDNETGSLELVAARGESEFIFQDLFLNASGFGLGFYNAGSSSWNHILMHTEPAMSLDTSQGSDEQPHLWDFAGGRLHIVDLMPNGEASPTGGAEAVSTIPYAHRMSEDGSRIFWNTGEGALYLRENDTTTVPISASQRAENEGEIVPAAFNVASANGNIVYFTSFANLTEASETEGSPSLYRYEVETGDLTDLTPAVPGGAQVGQVLGSSADGSYVYFDAGSALAPGATPAGGFSENTNIYLWHDGAIKFIAQTDEGGGEPAGPPQAAVSPDGRYFGIGSFSQLTPADELSAACPTDAIDNNPPEHCRQVYVYEAETEQLSCVTCSAPAKGFSSLGGYEQLERGMGDEFPRAVLDDGTVFVDTPNRLLPGDANGTGDVYAWREGQLGLVSTGMAEGESTFASSTPDASDVFLLTNQPLVGQDIDNNVDLYDARIGGGLAGQFPPGSPPPCEGEGCRAAVPAATAAAAPGSAGAEGAGNLPARCARLIRKATETTRRAHRLQHRASDATGRNTAKLRHRAGKAGYMAHRLNAKARNCGGQG